MRKNNPVGLKMYMLVATQFVKRQEEGKGDAGYFDLDSQQQSRAEERKN